MSSRRAGSGCVGVAEAILSLKDVNEFEMDFAEIFETREFWFGIKTELCLKGGVGGNNFCQRSYSLSSVLPSKGSSVIFPKSISLLKLRISLPVQLIFVRTRLSRKSMQALFSARLSLTRLNPEGHPLRPLPI